MSYRILRPTDLEVTRQLKEQFKEDVSALTSEDIKSRRPVYLESDTVCGIEATEAVMNRLENAWLRLHQDVRIPINVTRDHDGRLHIVLAGDDVQVGPDFIVPIARSTALRIRDSHFQLPENVFLPGPPTLAACSVFLEEDPSLREDLTTNMKLIRYLDKFAKKNGSRLPSFFLRIVPIEDGDEDEDSIAVQEHRPLTGVKNLLTGLFRRGQTADTTSGSSPEPPSSSLAETSQPINESSTDCYDYFERYHSGGFVDLTASGMSYTIGLLYSSSWTHYGRMKCSLVSEDEAFSITASRIDRVDFGLRAVVQESKEMLTAVQVWEDVLARRRERETDA